MIAMKRFMFLIVVLAFCLYSNPAGAVDIMASGRYVPDTKEGGAEFQVIGDLPGFKGGFADHFFVVGGLSGDNESLDGYEGLLGVRFFTKESRFNIGTFGGLAAQILNLVSDEKADMATYGMATGGAFLSGRFSDNLTGVVGWQYFKPMEKDTAAETRHEFGVGLIFAGLFGTD